MLVQRGEDKYQTFGSGTRPGYRRQSGNDMGDRTNRFLINEQIHPFSWRLLYSQNVLRAAFQLETPLEFNDDHDHSERNRKVVAD